MKINLEVQELIVLGDSDLIFDKLKAMGKLETSSFFDTNNVYIPRFHNELTDALATLASIFPYPGNTCITPLKIQVHDPHYYSNTIEVEPNGEKWYLDIKHFLADRKISRTC
ncbi:hypothetical protein R3W88_024508 [Solanum pinnatisectum]|uniref:RNase H type-1 domain-containing protein n=1 Tax=Solanum pinnatisectum TaxID=50273 RepID=A0AAV9M3I8_9SOLN|nr:hypothetical protein R3W88_024508 [Solanum pinnatisectum]